MHTVLVPPLLCSGDFYRDLVAAVWTFGAVTIADTRRDASLAGMARRLLDSSPEHFTLVGTSMGGYVALEVIRQAPERVQGLVLISTSARPDSPDQVAARRSQATVVESGRFDALVDAVFPALVAAGHEDDTALLAQWRETAHQVGPEAFLTQQVATMNRLDSRPLLTDVACPALVIHGMGDRLIAPSEGRELAELMPNAQLELIPDAGHFVLKEQPDVTAQKVADFLLGLRPSAV